MALGLVVASPVNLQFGEDEPEEQDEGLDEEGVVLANPLCTSEAIDCHFEGLLFHEVEEPGRHGLHLHRFNREINPLYAGEVDVGRVQAAFDGFQQVVRVLAALRLGPFVLVSVEDGEQCVEEHVVGGVWLVQG